MIRTICYFVCFQFMLFFLMGCEEQITEKPTIAIIPAPQIIEQSTGYFEINESTAFYSNLESEQLHSMLANFNEILTKEVNFKLSFSSSKETKDQGIRIEINPNLFPESSEAYTLDIEKNGVLIRANSLTGVFYGLQSLRQLWVVKQKEQLGKSVLRLPYVQIKDKPRFPWRGVMLDESRHFFGVSKVKQLLDMMSFHKLNRFHWHLTDAPGWRIEIKAFPNLTRIGAIGNHSDAKAKAAFYTQAEIKEIVAYAEARFIEVIPEIDMPGHASAAVRSYPELSGGGSKKHPEFTFHPAKQGTYDFLTTVLKELGQLFPSKYIHIGADEVSFGNQQWATDPEVKALMNREGLANIKEVESYFINRMRDTILAMNKEVMGWDEVVENNMNIDKTTVMWWRHDRTEVLESALEKGYQTVLCPRLPLYFDFDQDESHTLGRRWKGYAPLKDVYQFPDSLNSVKHAPKNVLGIQANIWTERINTEKRLDYMTYPRLSALSEAAWTNKGRKSFEEFEERLIIMFEVYEALAIHYYNPFEPESTPEPGKKLEAKWQENF